MKEAADDMATQAEIVDLLTFMCRSAFASPKWEAICGLDDGMNSAHVQARALYGPFPARGPCPQHNMPSENVVQRSG